MKYLDIKSDKWEIEHFSSLGSKLVFSFSYLPNNWFKKIHKQITSESITIGKPSLVTLHRYNYSLKHFFQFIKQYEIELRDYEQLTHQHTQMFLFYLIQQDMANSTRSIIISSLKWVIQFGQRFEIEGFPKKEVFDGDEFQAIKTEDVLKTKYLSDEIMLQIESALIQEKNLLLKCLLVIGIDTGIRLSEALKLSQNCIHLDFTGKPVLHVLSSKNETERFIPVSPRVKKAIKTLEQISEEGRKQLGTNILSVYWQSKNKRYAILSQDRFRASLSFFVKRHKILDNIGNLYPVTYHAFRHTLGTDMLNKGMSIFEISDYLGHESSHSTAGYAKLKSAVIQKEYTKLGFVGMIVKEINESSLGIKNFIDDNSLKSAALPDGTCKKPLDNQGKVCAKFNMCIICPKFITTPDHLSVHKSHLDRLRADKRNYMTSEFIGTHEHLETIEYALETIIERLEKIQNGYK